MICPYGASVFGDGSGVESQTRMSLLTSKHLPGLYGGAGQPE
jgi:hypothetical protein